MRRIEPPSELRDFHSATIRVGAVSEQLADEVVRGALEEDSEDIRLAVLLLHTISAVREAASLPEDVRVQLERSGCIEDLPLGQDWSDVDAAYTVLIEQILAEFEPEILQLMKLDQQPTGARASTQPTPIGTDGPPSGRTLDDVLGRGYLLCGVKQTHPLFGFKEADGAVTGFDIEFCKAIAAATLGDANAVEYVDASDASTRFELLADKEIDVLIRTTTVTATRDHELPVDFAQPIFYDGQGFLVRKDAGFDAISDLAEATICVRPGTIREQNVADHFTDIGLIYRPPDGLSPDVADAFFTGHCDALTADVSDLAARISVRFDRGDYKLLPQVISKEPLAPVVRESDGKWKDVVNWVVHGLIAAEELGITRANVAALAADPPSAEVARLLGVPYGGFPVSVLGFAAIDAQFIQRAIAAVGNYGEIYERTIGDWIPRTCTRNALAIDDSVACPPGQGGIMYALPYR